VTARGREGPIVGGLLVLLGIVALREGWRLRGLRETLVAGAMVGYWFLAPWLGYTAATALVALALYRGLGGYHWPAALALAAVSTAALHLMFRVWLLQPLPSGMLGG